MTDTENMLNYFFFFYKPLEDLDEQLHDCLGLLFV